MISIKCSIDMFIYTFCLQLLHMQYPSSMFSPSSSYRGCLKITVSSSPKSGTPIPLRLQHVPFAASLNNSSINVCFIINTPFFIQYIILCVESQDKYCQKYIVVHFSLSDLSSSVRRRSVLHRRRYCRFDCSFTSFRIISTAYISAIQIITVLADSAQNLPTLILLSSSEPQYPMILNTPPVFIKSVAFIALYLSCSFY